MTSKETRIITEISKEDYLQLNEIDRMQIHINSTLRRKAEGYYDHLDYPNHEKPLDPEDPHDYEFGKSAGIFE